MKEGAKVKRTIGGQRGVFECKEDQGYVVRKNCGQTDKSAKWQCLMCGKGIGSTVNFGYKRSAGTSLISLL